MFTFLMIVYASSTEAKPLKIPGTKAQTRDVVELAKVVAKSLRKSRDDRFQSASEMKAHIERIDRCK